MTDWSRPVQVASVQTLQRRPIPEADVVIIDECHRWFDFYPKWMMDPAWQSRKFIGLSATPWTRGLGRYFDDLIIAATTGDLIAGGYLSPFRVFAPSHPNLTGVRTVAGDYHEGDLSGVMNDSIFLSLCRHTGASPQGVTIGPDGKTAFVTLKAAGHVVVVDLASAKIVKELVVGGGSDGVGVARRP